MRTLDQLRAEFAWRQVQNPRKEYRNLAKSLPALVMSNGLMQTLAFLEGKGGEHRRLLEDIRLWLANPDTALLPAEVRDFRATMEALTAMDTLRYQLATEETLAILRWIRHLASAVDSEE